MHQLTGPDLLDHIARELRGSTRAHLSEAGKVFRRMEEVAGDGGRGRSFEAATFRAAIAADLLHSMARQMRADAARAQRTRNN